MNTAIGSKASVKRKDQNETTIKFILRSVRATPEALQAFNEAQGKRKQTHHKNHPNGREIIKVTEESREQAFNVATKELVRRFPIKRR